MMKKENKRPANGSKAKLSRHFLASLSKSHRCTILITCTDPKADGSLDIEMTYTGKDPCLASLMVEKAQEKLEEDLLAEVQCGHDEFC